MSSVDLRSVAAYLPDVPSSWTTEQLRRSIGGLISRLREEQIEIPDVHLCYNHDETGKVMYQYPLIQYRHHKDRPLSIWAYGRGVPVLMNLVGYMESLYDSNHKKYPIRSIDIYPIRTSIGLRSDYHKYQLIRWIPLNSNNYKQFKNQDLDGSEMQSRLSDILAGHIKGCMKGLGLPISVHINPIIEQITRTSYRTFRVKKECIDIIFRSRVLLPDDICIGKESAFGAGLIKRIA